MTSAQKVELHFLNEGKQHSVTYISIQLDGIWGLATCQQNANCEPSKLPGSYLEDSLSAEDMSEISLVKY